MRFALAVLLAAASLTAAELRFEAPLFRVSGWTPERQPDDWTRLFAIYAGEGDLPPMLGSYRVAGGGVIFEPRFPLRAGVRYRAVFRGVTPEITAVFELPATHHAPSTSVEHVYPSADLLPGNQLKFYLCFSAPMQRGEAWRRVHLYDAAGKQVELPFLELQQELWDADYRRLTVLFDPGRIKRGLLPLQEAGPAIEEGKRYTLEIDAAWRDAAGVTMAEGFRKSFGVTAADRTPPDPAQWRVGAPPASTTAPLTLDFPKPMDYALLLHLIEIADGAGRLVGGEVTVERNETRWTFTPREPWKAGDYQVLIDTALEDLAGNRIGRPFDVDTFERVERPERKQVRLSFRVGR